MVEGWCVGRVVGISSEIKCVGCIGNYSFGLYEWDLFYVQQVIQSGNVIIEFKLLVGSVVCGVI